MNDKTSLLRRSTKCLRNPSAIKLLAGVALMLPVAVYAFSPPTASVPEPDTLALLGIGAVAWIAGKWLRK